MVPRVDRIYLRFDHDIDEKISVKITYPCEERGVLTSHAQPHFAVVMAGRAIKKKRSLWEPTAVQIMERQIPAMTQEGAKYILDKIVEMYTSWAPLAVDGVAEDDEENANGKYSDEVSTYRDNGQDEDSEDGDSESGDDEDGSGEDDIPGLDHSKGPSDQGPADELYPSLGETRNHQGVQEKIRIDEWRRGLALPDVYLQVCLPWVLVTALYSFLIINVGHSRSSRPRISRCGHPGRADA
jgi:hypothetical protein